MSQAPTRIEELRTNLDAIQQRIARAVAAARREPDDVELVVVTKNFPVADLEHLRSLGVHAIAENKAQELTAKYAGLSEPRNVTFHFVGQLQSNKASAVAACADVVQSVDRAKIAAALDRSAERAHRVLDVLIQVGLDTRGARGGAAPDQVVDLADQVAEAAHLHLRGVMAVAPRGADPMSAFRGLRQVAGGIRKRHPDATWISAGMSSDLEAAIACGATHLRVGTAILGTRASLG